MTIAAMLNYQRSSALAAYIVLVCLTSQLSFAANEKSTAGITNFAFASYLGTGFYTTSGQDVFVLQLPFKYVLKEKTDTGYGLLLKLPLTIGFINFDDIDFDNLPDIPKLDDVGTLTFLPGIEYQYPATDYWTVSPFLDYGFARDTNNTTNVLITGIGLKNIFDFQLDKNNMTIGNRLLYAREHSKISDTDSSYSLVETGIKYVLNTDTNIDQPLLINLYYINFYYPKDLVFLESTTNPVRVGHENEIGLTISNIPSFLFFEDPQLGFGIRMGNNLTAYRIVFGAPF
jgi:hypothetical protein